jgi:hypothetical protein
MAERLLLTRVNVFLDEPAGSQQFLLTSRPDRCARTMEIIMRRVLVIAMQAALFGCIPAFAQVGGMGSPTPGIGATSPLGMAPGSPVPPAGIPMGATELTSPGLSGIPMGATGLGTMGMTGNGTTCLDMGSPSLGMSGSSTNFDGGGLGAGTGTLPSGAATSGTCGTSSSSRASSSAATSPTSPGGAARTGLPLGSVEIGNAGVSPLLVVPTPSPNPSTMGSGMPCSTTGFSPSSSSMSSTGC